MARRRSKSTGKRTPDNKAAEAARADKARVDKACEEWLEQKEVEDNAAAAIAEEEKCRISRWSHGTYDIAVEYMKRRAATLMQAHALPDDSERSMQCHGAILQMTHTLGQYDDACRKRNDAWSKMVEDMRDHACPAMFDVLCEAFDEKHDRRVRETRERHILLSIRSRALAEFKDLDSKRQQAIDAARAAQREQDERAYHRGERAKHRGELARVKMVPDVPFMGHKIAAGTQW